MENNELLESLAAALQPYQDGQKAHGGFTPYGLKASGTPSETAYLYEGGGLFGRCDGPRQLINAMVGPVGFEKVLRWVGTASETELVDAWTAMTETGSNQTTVCGDCPSLSLQACVQNYCLGRFCAQTDELQFDRLGMHANPMVPTKTLFGSVTDAAGNVLIPQGQEITNAFVIQSKTTGYSLRLKNSQLLWTGSPGNNVGRAYQEYKGFETIINTGKFDHYSEIPCDGLDSFLLDYQSNAIASDGALAITDYFRRMVLEFMTRAEGAGMSWDSAQMYIVMSQNMWDGIAKRYACAGIDLCALSNDASRATVSIDQAQGRYEEYLTRLALPIYGRWYPVVLDSQITETAGQPNGICSDIYFITTTIQGEEITFGQYQDFNQTYGSIQSEMKSLFGSDDIAITDNGRFALVRSNSRGCFDVQAYTKPRVIMLMPFLAGRLQNVCHDVLGTPVPDVTLSGGVYEKGGGRSITTPPTLYGDC